MPGPVLLLARLAAVVETLLLASAHEQAELFQRFIPGRLTEFVILVVDGESRRLATAAADRLADAGAELRPVLLFERGLLLRDLVQACQAFHEGSFVRRVLNTLVKALRDCLTSGVVRRV